MQEVPPHKGQNPPYPYACPLWHRSWCTGQPVAGWPLVAAEPPICAPALHAAQVITSEIDEGIDMDFRVVPGCGNFGDRQAPRTRCMPAAREHGQCIASACSWLKDTAPLDVAVLPTCAFPQPAGTFASDQPVAAALSYLHGNCFTPWRLHEFHSLATLCSMPFPIKSLLLDALRPRLPCVP